MVGRPVPVPPLSAAEAATRRIRQGEGVDRIGALASSICAVHCALAAFVPAALAASGVGFLLGEGAEWTFTVFAVGMATAALVTSWRRHHSRSVAALFVAGIAALLLSRGIEGLAHHGEEGDSAHNAAAVAQGDKHDHAAADNHDHAAADTDAEPEATHLAGIGVGVMAGLLLLAGHITNVRRSRCCASGSCIAPLAPENP